MEPWARARYAPFVDRARTMTAGGVLVVHGAPGSGRTSCCSALGDALGAASAMIVDDADLLDPAEFDRLRAEATGQVLVLTCQDPASLGLAPPAAAWLELPALGRDDLDALVTEISGERAGESTLRRLGALAGGNLRTAAELIGALSPAQVRSGDGLDADLLATLPSARWAAARMRELSPAARCALQVTALGEREPLDVLQRALADLGAPDDALDQAEEAGWIRTDRDGVTFAHPLQGVAASTLETFARRRTAALALAAAVATVDPLRSAWYESLYATAPDAELALRLRELAEATTRGGDPSFATEIWQAAARLATHNPESALARAADAAHMAGRFDDAVDLALRVLTGDPSPNQRIEARRVQGLAMIWQGRPEQAYHLLADEAAQLGPRGGMQATTLLLQGALGALHAGDLSTGRRLAQLAAETGRALGPLGPASAAVEGHTMMMLGDPAGVDLVRDAARLHELAARFVADALPALHLTSWVGRMLVEIGEHDAAVTMLTWTIETAEHHRAPVYLLMPHAHRALAWLRAGRLDLADADTATFERLADTHGHAEHRMSAASLRGRLDVLRGVEAGWSTLRQVAQRSAGPAHIEALVALGSSALSVGDVDEALHVLERVRSSAQRTGLAHPAFVPYEADLVEALVRAGDLEHATTLAKAQAEVATRWPLLLVKGLAERSLSLVAVDPAVAGDHATRSLELLGRAGSPLEAARTALVHGERLRRLRARAEARRFLREALDGFERVGATAWATRARDELRAAGARGEAMGPDLTGLTDREATIAREVASGRTNREVAAALHMSPKTVENQLSRIYAKLGVRSRTELARLLSDGG